MDVLAVVTRSMGILRQPAYPPPRSACEVGAARATVDKTIPLLAPNSPRESRPEDKPGDDRESPCLRTELLSISSNYRLLLSCRRYLKVPAVMHSKLREAEEGPHTGVDDIACPGRLVLLFIQVQTNFMHPLARSQWVSVGIMRWLTENNRAHPLVQPAMCGFSSI